VKAEESLRLRSASTDAGAGDAPLGCCCRRGTRLLPSFRAGSRRSGIQLLLPRTDITSDIVIYLYDELCSYTFKSFCRILDNLPLVVPIARQDKDAFVYQGGYHVGVEGQYAGVSSFRQLTISLTF
jgi:hypothetical protein